MTGARWGGRPPATLLEKTRNRRPTCTRQAGQSDCRRPQPLDIADAVELNELLQFVNDWLASDTERLDAALTHYVGHPACTADELRADLDRFIFLLGGNDGEPLFGHE